MPGRKILYVSRVRCVTGELLNYLMLVMMVLFGDIVLMFLVLILCLDIISSVSHLDTKKIYKFNHLTIT